MGIYGTAAMSCLELVNPRFSTLVDFNNVLNYFPLYNPLLHSAKVGSLSLLSCYFQGKSCQIYSLVPPFQSFTAKTHLRLIIRIVASRKLRKNCYFVEKTPEVLLSRSLKSCPPSCQVLNIIFPNYSPNLISSIYVHTMTSFSNVLPGVSLGPCTGLWITKKKK